MNGILLWSVSRNLKRIVCALLLYWVLCICFLWFIFLIIWHFSGAKLLYGKDTPVYSTALMGNKGSTYDDSLFDRHAGTNWDYGSWLACAWGGGHYDYTVTELLGCGPCGLLDPAAPIFGIEYPQLRAACVYLVCRQGKSIGWSFARTGCWGRYWD